MKKSLVAAVTALIAASAHAFMPAPGIWNFENENVGQPGRGMMIEVQNEVVFLSYFGYRADGSSVKYYASGPLVNNSFTGDLIDFVGGPAIGGPIQPARNNGAIGKVTLSFTSGTYGTITLPNDSPRPIYKNSFGYAYGPDGLLGTWIFSETIISTFSVKKTLSVKLAATTSGNGIVSTAGGEFACEYQVSGAGAGTVMCVTVPVTTVSDNYVIRFAGDRGTGIDMLNINSSTPSAYPAHALRVNTKTGAQTGLNDATATAVTIKASIRPDASPQVADTAPARTLESSSHAGVQYEVSDLDAFTQWAAQAASILSK